MKTNMPSHCNYGEGSCCGIFMIEDEEGNVICNECGMTLLDLLKPLENHLAKEKHIGWYDPQTKRYCHLYEKEAWPDRWKGHTVKVFVTL